MARMLNPVTGIVEEIDDALVPFMLELWNRLGEPLETLQDAAGTLPAPGIPPVPASAPESRSEGVQGASQRGPIPVGKPAWHRRETRRLIVPWQPAEVDRVRDGLPARYQLMTDLGASLGLRQGELFGFHLDDLDHRKENYRIRVQVKRVNGQRVFAPPKHERERSVPVPADLRTEIGQHAATWGTTAVTLPWCTPDGPLRTCTLLHAGQHGSALDAAYMNRLWKTAVDAAGIPWIPQDTGFHMLRHVAASRWIANGADVLMVRELLGHADIETTEKYLHRLKTHDQRTRRVVAKAAPKRASRKPAPLPAGVVDFAGYRSRRS
jgi:integrase